MTFLYLFFEFFKTGLFAIGGGLATIPFLMDIANRYDWFTQSELTDMIAISESTPGPIGINMATYAGYNAGYTLGGIPLGILGGIVATLSLVLPSIIIILIVAKILEKFKESKIVKSAFYSLRPAVIGLLVVSLLGVALPIFFDFTKTTFLEVIHIKEIVFFGLLLFGILKFKKHPIVYIGIGALVGIIFKF